jgi:hypothetical protein
MLRQRPDLIIKPPREPWTILCFALDAAPFVLASHCRARGHFHASMGWKRKVSGGMLAMIGFMLSPLSWWNDLFVNLPLALVFAWTVSYFYKPAFEECLIVGYWLTNVVGFVLLQKGGERVFSEADKPYSRRTLLRDVGISLLYTGLIVLLLKGGVLKPIQHYFEGS